MPRRPWYPWFPGDYLQDTLHLTLEECGAYRRLLDWSWINGPIPDSTSAIARILRVSPQKCRALMKSLGRFFQKEGGVLVSKRLEKVRDHSEAISLKRKEAALANAGANGGTNGEQNRVQKQSKTESDGKVGGHSAPMSLIHNEAALANAGANAKSINARARGVDLLDLFKSPTETKDLAEKEAEFDELIWKIGVGLVGGSESTARAFLGKLVKKHGKEKVAGVIGGMTIARPVEPKAYLVAALKEKKRGLVL